MKNFCNILFLLIFLGFGITQQVKAATLAEASTGNASPSVGKYDISDMTEDEQEWFLTFLKGNFFADGWEQISTDIVGSTLAEEREQQQMRLDELGYKIGREWCKGNEARKIHTPMLKEWGRQLKDTAKDAPHLLTEVIQNIHNEVDQLIN